MLREQMQQRQGQKERNRTEVERKREDLAGDVCHK